MPNDIAYIRTEPLPQTPPCRYSAAPRFRCTIELVDGTTIMRCGATPQHALANAVACYKTTAQVRLSGPQAGGPTRPAR